MSAGVVEVTYFSDVLCIWAYISQARVDEACKRFGDQIRINHQFCSIFGDTTRKIPTVWAGRGEYAGFNKHLMEVAARFPHITVNPDIWLTARPASSTSPHLFLTALRLWEQDMGSDVRPSLFELALWDMRCAFFRDGRDIADRDVQVEIARSIGADVEAVERRIHDGSAFARLASDYQDAEKAKIEGSPSFVLNSGRQKLYGNVGFRLIEANIRELLREPQADDASWC